MKLSVSQDSLLQREQAIPTLSKLALFSYAGVTLAICVLFFEAFLRLTGYVRGYNDPTLYRVSQSGTRHELSPGWSGFYAGAAVRVNSLGLRGPEFPIGKPPQEFRILALGDSAMFGQGVEEPDTFAAQLEKLLQAARPHRIIRVINAGVPAYHTVAELDHLRGLLRLHPDMLIVGYAVDNDTDIDVGMRIDRVSNRVYDTAVNYSFFGQISYWLHRHSSAYNFIRSRLRILMHPQQKEKQLSAQEAFADDSPGWRASRHALMEIHALAIQAKIPFIVGGIGLYQRIAGLDTLAAFCRQQGWPYVELWRTTDLSDHFGRYAVSAVDPHTNAIGHRISAERLLAAVLPWVP